MAETMKIVLTGGPCAGKTSAIRFLQKELEELDISVFIIEEFATKLMSEGKTPENMGCYDFHKLLFESQLTKEKELEIKAMNSDKDKAIILCDRGLLDNRAFVSEEEFNKYASQNGLNEEMIRNSYDAVFHLVSAANGTEENYNFKTNPVRSEDIELAKKLDEKILPLWVGTAHLRVIDNSTSFDKKLNRLLDEVKGFIGVPEPLEIERKFLIEYPDIDLLQNMVLCRKVPITQAYLTTPEEGNFRIRKRGNKKNAVYIKTVKFKINDIKRIEKETFISKEEYNRYLSQKKYITGIISKDRYCIVYDNTYYELDVYPFWTDRATLEIELLSENQSYSLPPFIKLIREVSTEPEYRNLALAQKFKFFK